MKRQEIFGEKLYTPQTAEKFMIKRGEENCSHYLTTRMGHPPKWRRDAIDIGNDLTFQQVYNLAKTYESTEAQMAIIQPVEPSKVGPWRSK